MNSLPPICYHRQCSPTWEEVKIEDALRTSVEPVDVCGDLVPQSFLILLSAVEDARKEESESSTIEYKIKSKITKRRVLKKTATITGKRKFWAPEEDDLLKAYIASTKWTISDGAFPGQRASKYLRSHSLMRDAKQCRDRYYNYLHPDLDLSPLSKKEKRWIDMNYGEIIKNNGKISYLTIQRDLQRNFKVLRSPNYIKNYVNSNH